MLRRRRYGSWSYRIRRRRRGCFAFPLEIGPNRTANGESGERRESEPESASAESRRRGPDEPELAPKPEKEKTGPPWPPGPADHQANHYGQPYRDCTQQNVDECFGYRGVRKELHQIEESFLHFWTEIFRENKMEATIFPRESELKKTELHNDRFDSIRFDSLNRFD